VINPLILDVEVGVTICY